MTATILAGFEYVADISSAAVVRLAEPCLVATLCSRVVAGRVFPGQPATGPFSVIFPYDEFRTMAMAVSKAGFVLDSADQLRITLPFTEGSVSGPSVGNYIDVTCLSGTIEIEAPVGFASSLPGWADDGRLHAVADWSDPRAKLTVAVNQDAAAASFGGQLGVGPGHEGEPISTALKGWLKQVGPLQLGALSVRIDPSAADPKAPIAPFAGTDPLFQSAEIHVPSNRMSISIFGMLTKAAKPQFVTDDKLSASFGNADVVVSLPAQMLRALILCPAISRLVAPPGGGLPPDCGTAQSATLTLLNPKTGAPESHTITKIDLQLVDKLDQKNILGKVIATFRDAFVLTLTGFVDIHYRGQTVSPIPAVPAMVIKQIVFDELTEKDLTGAFSPGIRRLIAAACPGVSASPGNVIDVTHDPVTLHVVPDTLCIGYALSAAASALRPSLFKSLPLAIELKSVMRYVLNTRHELAGSHKVDWIEMEEVQTYELLDLFTRPKTLTWRISIPTASHALTKGRSKVDLGAVGWVQREPLSPDGSINVWLPPLSPRKASSQDVKVECILYPDGRKLEVTSQAPVNVDAILHVDIVSCDGKSSSAQLPLSLRGLDLQVDGMRH